MKIIPCLLGDAHNFDRTVSLYKHGTIYKPRNVLWESLLLSQSTYRQQLDEFFAANNLISPFAYMPILKYKCDQNFPFCGETDYIQLDSHASYSEKAAASAGAICALCVYLGIGDLHSENILFGAENGKPTMGPIDIESIFFAVHLPSQIYLVPKITDKNAFRAPGLLNLFASFYSKKPHLIFAFLSSYYKALSLNVMFGEKFLPLFKDSIPDINHCPIRVIIRQTQDYADLLNNKVMPLSTPLIQEEIVQLKRQDIPYFFTFHNDINLYYFTSKTWEYEPVKLQNSFWRRFSIVSPIDFRQPNPFAHFTDGLLEKSLKQGLAQFASYFVSLTNNKYVNLSHEDSRLASDGKYIYLELDSVFKLKWKSNF